tara:strand:+ start:201 stop:608 length:408 start_codon:yes stop_codon:yes gene_type:complete
VKKLLLILLLSFLSTQSFATYLVCDAGYSVITTEPGISKGTGESFEVELLDNGGAILHGLQFCNHVPMPNTTESNITLTCRQTYDDEKQHGFLDISRISGQYSYFYMLTFKKAVILAINQNGQCEVRQQKLFQLL